ncbi:hypothetical protein TIFTF001_032311 [Ficus carica]|uniref:Uncharacterized protein n=1 Tax=Ficus carica TaxID=3494 RepID=A0AA88E391_FICCA|nr:hypothetical protein TIFTF001_032311 [Ficus carica]
MQLRSADDAHFLVLGDMAEEAALEPLWAISAAVILCLTISRMRLDLLQFGDNDGSQRLRWSFSDDMTPVIVVAVAVTVVVVTGDLGLGFD